MVDKLGKAIFEIRADTDSLKKDLGKAKSDIQGTMSSLRSKMKNVGAGMALALTAPIALFGKAAVQAAADAEEMQSKFSVVFGAMSGDVEDWAKVTGDKVQRSSNILKKAAADTQSLLLSAGLTAQEATKLSKSMTELALDVASFNNASDDQAINAFQKALLGENEMLKGVQLALSQAEVQQELLNMGIEGGWNEVTRANKAFATYQALVSKTSQMQGDLARTAGSTTNQMKAFESAMLDLKVAIGQEIIPLFTPLVTLAKDLVNQIVSLDKEVLQAGIVFAAFIAVLGPLALIIAALMSPIGLIITGIAALGTAFVFYKDEIVGAAQALYNGVSTWFQKLRGTFKPVDDMIKATTMSFEWMWDQVVGNSFVPDMVDGIESEFSRLGAVMVEPAKKATEAVTKSFEKMSTRASIDIRNIQGSLENFFFSLVNQRVSASFNETVGGPINKIFDSLFDNLPGFANGGRPSMGKPSIVGERGPELFIPDSAGTIVPNNALGGGAGGVQVVNNNNFAGVDSVNQAELLNALNINKQQTIQTINDLTRRGT